MLEFTITRYFFTLKMISMDSLTQKNVGKDTKFIAPGQIQMELYWV